MGLYKTYYGMFRGRIKDRGGKDQIGPGRNECKKIEKKGDKRSWTCVNRLLVSMLVLGSLPARAPFLVGDGFGVLKDTDSQSVSMIIKKWKSIQR